MEYKKARVEIIIHHSASSNADVTTPAQAQQKVQAIYRFHALTRAWGDIGYNFLVDQFGTIYEGRAGGQDVIGAHAKYNNQSSIGIVLLGNFEVDVPTNAQVESLIKAVVGVSRLYHINPYDKVTYHEATDSYPYIEDMDNYALVGHRDTEATTCPGTNLYLLLPAIREEVSRRLNGQAARQIDVQKTLANANKAFIPVDGDPSLVASGVDFFVSTPYIMPTDTYTIVAPIVMPAVATACSISDKNISVDGCLYADGKLTLTLHRLSNTMSS